MANVPTRIFMEKHTVAPCSALELICSTRNLVELRAAVDNGADWVKLDIRIDHFEGFSFDNGGMQKGIRYAHDRQCKVLVSLEGNPAKIDWKARREIVDSTAKLGVDAFVLSDPALMLYIAANYSKLQLCFAAGEATPSRESIDFYRRGFGASRILLPRVLSLPMLEELGSTREEEFMVFGFIKLTTTSSRKRAQALPLRHVHSFHTESSTLGRTADTSTLSGTLERCATEELPANDQCFDVGGTFDLNTLRFLPQLSASGVRAIVIDAPLHAPMYLAQATRVWRAALEDYLENGEDYHVKPSWFAKLEEQPSGSRTPFRRPA